MLLSSRRAGITCDEILHYKQSVAVFNYFASHGTDQSALNTPVTNLKYYGQSYDNIVTILTRWLGIDDIYLFRNYMSGAAGWAAIFITALFAIWLAGYRSGILAILLFAVSPTFIGHSQNNLKDVPFALSYIAGTFFILRFIFEKGRKSFPVLLMVTLSIAFSISIRAGGLVLICYLWLIFFVAFLLRYISDSEFDRNEFLVKFVQISIISVTAWILGILLWPYALQHPVRNVINAYNVMAHFPSTFRQIFEGKVEWSDFMPWYYLPKSMLITIPLVVIAGILLLVFPVCRKVLRSKALQYGFILFTIIFPVTFVIFLKSNLYSSWRQFLFLYPAIVLLSAIGFSYFFDFLKSKILRFAAVAAVILLSIHPDLFIVKNLPYSYIYYNQLAGGIKGAYSNYETDYYYVSQKEAAEWLTEYLEKSRPGAEVKVGATYTAEWFFRKHPEIKSSYFRYEERSLYDWDYAIVVNRYISPFQLRNKTWPPSNAINLIYAGKIPICAVLERKTKDDFYGYSALIEGKSSDAVKLYEKALKSDDDDEMIFYNFGAALYDEHEYQKADSVLKKGLELNPGFDLALMYLGNIARAQNKKEDAEEYYRRLIKSNRKYFEAYVSLAELLKDKDRGEARLLLRKCLEMNPSFKPAITTLADTYRNSAPEVAKKYDVMAAKIKE